MLSIAETIRHRLALAASVALLLALAGCAHQPYRSVPAPGDGHASWREVEAPDTTHYDLAIGQVASGGEAIDRSVPVYPPALLAACPPPIEVQAKLIVDSTGRVSEVRVTHPEPAPAQQLFDDAVGEAALDWRFAPLQFDRFAADANGNSHAVERVVRPFSLDYVFRFSCRAGRPLVTGGADRASG